MRLSDFFGSIAPYLEGRTSHAEVVRVLYGAGGGPGEALEVDARRLSIYGRFCRTHRFEVVDSIYQECHAAVRARGGDAAWEALVEAFFLRHPMQHFELNANGADLPGFLVGHVEGAGLPAWLPELADFEWWEWQAVCVLDNPADDERGPGGGPLRLASTVELRPYRYDFVGWLDGAGPADRAPEPDAEDGLVLFWRTRTLTPRRDKVRPIELAVLKAVSEGMSLQALAAVVPEPREELEATLRDLSEAGIVLGRP